MSSVVRQTARPVTPYSGWAVGGDCQLVEQELECAH